MMSDLPITPPVLEDAVIAADDVAKNGANVTADLTLFQKVVASDKSAIVAAVVHVAVLLVAAFRLHLSGTDVATLGSIVAAGLAYFVHLDLNKK